MEDNGVLC